METKIYLIRHGQSIGNLLKRCLGHTDKDLTDLGKQQAEAAAERLKNEHIDCIYSSDLLRAHNTALPHSIIHNLPINDSVELREIFLGDWEDCSVQDLIDNQYNDFVLGWKQNFGTFCPPNGESVQELATRIHEEICRIASINVGKTILITTHAAAIRALWGKISGVEPSELAEKIPFPENASISTVIFDGEKLIPRAFSDDEHIKGTPLEAISVNKVF